MLNMSFTRPFLLGEGKGGWEVWMEEGGGGKRNDTFFFFSLLLAAS